MTDAAGTPLVEMRDISLAFGGIHAVDRVSIDLGAGEVLALVGHNGAGKSTLIKILSGAYRRDSGSITIRGAEAAIANPRDAKSYGHNAFKIDLARRAIVRALTQAARGTPQSQSNKKIR